MPRDDAKYSYHMAIVGGKWRAGIGTPEDQDIQRELKLKSLSRELNELAVKWDAEFISLSFSSSLPSDMAYAVFRRRVEL